MATSTTAGRPALARRALGAVAALALLTGCGTQVVGGGAAGDPPLLRIGSPGATVSAADAATHSGLGGAITLDGTLPTGPERGSVRRFGTDRIPEQRVRELAAALGVDADPVRRAHGWEVEAADGAVLRVRDGDGEWSFSRAGLECPAYLVDIESEQGSATVSCASGGSSTDDPAPAVPVPDDRAALAAAVPVLAVAGLADSARVPARTGGPARTVVADPVVAGLRTSGLRTVVDVDREGVLGGHGRLGTTTEGATYPLVSARAAYDGLAGAPRPLLPELACLESKDGRTVCPEPTPLVVTGATLGLELAYEDGAALLVPAWLFDVRGSDEPLAAVAVEPRFLADSEPGTGATAQPGAGSAPGSGGAADPGAPAQPAPDGPVAPDPGSGTTGVAVASAEVSPDGRTLTLVGWGGVCATYLGLADESSTAVKVQIVGTSTIGPDEACADMAQQVEVRVALDKPLGSRAVSDATTGQKLRVTGR
jgi:hypothetical protein